MITDNLNKYTKEQKLRLLDLIKEKKRRLRDRKAVYKPNAGQLPVHKSAARERFVLSGNGAGKTAMSINEAIWAVQGYNPFWEKFTHVPARVIVLLDSPSKVADLWLPELQKWYNLDIEKQCDKAGKPYYSKIHFANGSEILFMFHNQEAPLFESIEADYIIADEPFPRHVYVALKRGLRKKHSNPKILCVGTPITGSWIRQELYEPWSKGQRKDIEFFRFATDVNKENLADGYIDYFFSNLTEKEQKIRREGIFYDLDGLALAHLFNRDKHVTSSITWNFPRNPCVIAIDPHPSKAGYAILVGADEKNQIVVIDEYSRKATAREFITDLIEKKQWFVKYKITEVVFDSLGSAENTSSEGFKPFGIVANEVLDKYGYARARATRYKDKSDEDFIGRIQELLTASLYVDPNADPDSMIPKLKVLSRCRGFISDLENVTWLPMKNHDLNKPKLDIRNKDFLACFKYALATNIYYSKPAAKVWRMKEQPIGTVGDNTTRPAKARKLKMQLMRRAGVQRRK